MTKLRKFIKVDDHIELCPPKAKMAEALFQIIDNQRAYLRKWLIWVDNTKSVKDTELFLKGSNAFNHGGQRLTTIITYHGQIAGCIGFVKLDKINRTGEVGYWLREDFQNNGIITKSCKKLISYAFKHLDLNRIQIRMPSENIKSKAIPVKLGFTYEGTQRQAIFKDDRFYDCELYSILKKEWL